MMSRLLRLCADPIRLHNSTKKGTRKEAFGSSHYALIYIQSQETNCLSKYKIGCKHLKAGTETIPAQENLENLT